MRVISSIFSALLAATAALPATAGERDGIVALLAPPCEPEQARQASGSTTAAFLAEHGWALAPSRPLANCKPDGAPCSADADCCSGVCKPAAEGRVCVPK
jgi:hypothetical protein